MYRLGVVAMTAAVAVAAHGHHHRPGCRKLFTVKMAERLAQREWHGLHTPSRHGWKVLLYLARCEQNRQAGHFVHWYYRHQAALNAQRRAAAAEPSLMYGEWAIPGYIVGCESGYQDEPVGADGNHTTASGYYQLEQETWFEYRRSSARQYAEAYEAPKIEQDWAASKLWDGGNGRHAWVCA